MDDLSIGGVTPMSTLDYPGALAAVVFCRGCPWRCPYCHNAALRESTEGGGQDFDAVLAWLESRRGLLDAVVFSGGEPTGQPGLAAAITAVRRLGFATGLHTAGMFPEALAAVLPLCDWVGLDIKAPRAAYARISGLPGSVEQAFASLARLVQSGRTFETRTTWHPALLDEADLITLAQELAEARAGHWVIQAFRPDGCADPDLVAGGPAHLPPLLLARLRAAAPGLTITVRD